jgi:hypothetical protein
MPAYVIQGIPQRESEILNGLDAIGGRIDFHLRTLSALSNAFLAVIDAPGDAAEVGTIPGVYIVEGEFFHPFY